MARKFREYVNGVADPIGKKAVAIDTKQPQKPFTRDMGNHQEMYVSWQMDINLENYETMAGKLLQTVSGVEGLVMIP